MFRLTDVSSKMILSDFTKYCIIGLIGLKFRTMSTFRVSLDFLR